MDKDSDKKIKNNIYTETSGLSYDVDKILNKKDRVKKFHEKPVVVDSTFHIREENLDLDEDLKDEIMEKLGSLNATNNNKKEEISLVLLSSNNEILYKSIPDEHKNFRCLIGSRIILEGLIGAGKSTLGASLGHYLNKIGLKCKFFPEFKNDKLLKLYIGNMEKLAFPFQIIIARERLRIYKEANEFSNSGGISIIDRSLVGDFTFALMQKEKGFISEDEWDVYLDLIKQDTDNEPDIILYLKCTPEQAFERMKKRSIKAETKGYTLEYFKTLDDAYTKTIKSIKHNVKSLSWDDDKNVDIGLLSNKACEETLTMIKNFIINK